MFNTLLTRTDGAVATVTLNRPERKNAISPELANELLHALDAAFTDDAVRVVVLAGSGKMFCSGGDLGQMSSGDGSTNGLAIRGDFADVLLALMNAPKPVVARVHGGAMGGGLGLMAACTFAVASTDATFGMPEIGLGIFPMMIMAVLARNMPRRALLERMLLAERFDADEAKRLGLVNRAVPPELLDDAVATYARDLAARSPTAMRHGLLAHAKMSEMALADALPMLRDELYALFGTDDAREGLMAFMQKRTPVWTGK